jgi:hypothetical protein
MLTTAPPAPPSMLPKLRVILHEAMRYEDGPLKGFHVFRRLRSADVGFGSYVEDNCMYVYR